MKKFAKAACIGLMVAFVATLFTFAIPSTPAAYADASCPLDNGYRMIPITDGSFSTPDRPALDVKCTRVVRSVIVSLKPKDATGTINSISIVRGEKKDGVSTVTKVEDFVQPPTTEFGCSNAKVKNGDDLTLICGGPAVLKPGLTIYSANGSNFKSAKDPSATVEFKVKLSEDFSPQYKKIYGLPDDSTEKSIESTFGL